MLTGDALKKVNENKVERLLLGTSESTIAIHDDRERESRGG
jgi:hypothetical protein